MKRVAVALLVALALGIAAYFLLPRTRPGTQPPAATADVVPDVLAGDALRAFEAWYQAQPRFLVPVSSDGAAVLIVKFTDYQCPGCAWTHTAYAPVLAKWTKRPGAIKVVVKQYPLDTDCNPTVSRTLHPAACEAAVAVLLAATAQQPALEDWLYANHESLTPASVQQAAANIAHVPNLDAGRASALDTIRNDAQIGRMLGVSSTPTFFVNGVKLLRDGKLLQPAEFDAAIALEMRRTGRATP